MEEVQVLKGKEGFELLLEVVFDTCARIVNLKLTQVTTMAAFKAGVAQTDYSGKPGLFTMHDGVTMGDGGMVFRRLMDDFLKDIAIKHLAEDKVYPFEVAKEFSELVDKITFEFV